MGRECYWLGVVLHTAVQLFPAYLQIILPVLDFHGIFIRKSIDVLVTESLPTHEHKVLPVHRPSLIFLHCLTLVSIQIIYIFC